MTRIFPWPLGHYRKMVALTASSLVLAGCGVSAAASHGSSPKAASGKRRIFELITKSNASPYWLAVRDGADAAAKKYAGVTVRFEAPASGTDLATQISMVQTAITTHVSGIILAAQNPKALLSPVQSALKSKIPVVTVDSGISPNVSDSFLATSNIAAAKKLATYVAKKVGGKGEYAIIDFNEESSTGIARPKGFKEGMAAFPGMKYVGMQISNNVIATAKSEAETFLESHPKINVMFGANDRSAIGVAEAVQQMHLTGKVVVAGFDADLGEVSLIKHGVISASILQYPYRMGYQAVQELMDIKAGKSVPKRVDTPYMLVTPKNIGTPAAIKAITQYIPNYSG